MTRFGGPTTLIEIAGWRLLTDPTFDAPGRRYGFGFGTGSTKLEAPAIEPAQLGRIDAVLLSHDHHADNLDDAGRTLLADVPTVVTTVSGTSRLASPSVRGLLPWQTTTLSAEGLPDLEVTATPCRHGPLGSRPIVGEVIGFAIRVVGSERTDVWVSGDSVLYRRLREVAKRLTVDVAVLHLGSVRFGLTGPIRYSMNAAEAVTLIGLLKPRVAVPVHFDGWSHFREGEDPIRARFSEAPHGIQSRVRWLTPGDRVALTEGPADI